MEGHWVLAGAGDRVLRFVRLTKTGRRSGTVSPVLTVREVCRRLRKSRRQVYRYVQDGVLQPCARILGQWLFPAEEVARCTPRGIPAMLKPIFWDTPLSRVIPARHRDFVLARVLEYGDWAAVRWAFQMYSREGIAAFLKGRGADLLSERSWMFWSTVLTRRPPHQPPKSWRRPGRHWGGLP
ncbi:MAG: helix-turn-helix domain-containing protein [Candidatus Omnitrophica bacterium]|nr:helix-turn-helix domain-containing protein [Candidatus Omnitrophota bacterium]